MNPTDMCTAEQVQKIVHEELLKERGAFVGKFWAIIITMGVATASAWFGLYYQVQAISKSNEDNEQGLQRQIDSLRADYKEDITDIKNDVRYIRDALTK